jgi:hypothetical protein
MTTIEDVVKVGKGQIQSTVATAFIGAGLLVGGIGLIGVSSYSSGCEQEYAYLRTRADGFEVLRPECDVQVGESASTQALAFNAMDQTNRYQEIGYNNIVHSNGISVGDLLLPGEQVYIIAKPK